MKKKWIVIQNGTSPVGDGTTWTGYVYNDKAAAEAQAQAFAHSTKNPCAIFELIEVAKLKESPTVIEEVK